MLKQADVVMAMFLLGNEFTLEQKRRNFDYYDPLTTGDSSLSASIQSIVAAEIGDEDAACRYFDFALLMDLADVAGNVSDGVHIASAAGAWMALVFGFGGVRDFDGHLTIDPRLPQRFRSLGFSLRFQDRQLRVHLRHDREEYTLTEGDPLEITIRGHRHRLTVDTPIRVEPARGDDVGSSPVSARRDARLSSSGGRGGTDGIEGRRHSNASYSGSKVARPVGDAGDRDEPGS